MNLDAPIVNAPMGGAAGGRLAAAVSAAGGLGMVGMGSSATASQLRHELMLLGGIDRPFGIGLVHWVMADEPELLEVALAAQPALLSVSFGEDWSWVRRAHDAGVAVTTQVATVQAARRAVDAGVDVLVARGAEGGGHGEPLVGTLPLLAEVLDTVPVPVPVLAAGGVSSARSVAAVLAAGAAAAWVGTAFTTCAEALTPQASRDALVAGTETELTSEFDTAAGYRWPAGIPERVLRGTPVNAGQGIGSVSAVRSVAETMAQLCNGAELLLRRWA